MYAPDELRLLTEDDRPGLLAFLAGYPHSALPIVAQLGCRVLGLGYNDLRIWGFFVQGTIKSICYCSGNLIPVIEDERACEFFAEQIGPRIEQVSIMGLARSVRPLWQALSSRWGSSWANTRHLRWSQPLMLFDAGTDLIGDCRVHRVGREDLDAYYEASVAMYSEEVGITPVDSQGFYRRYIAHLIDSQMSFGAQQCGKFWFKTDIGIAWARRCQIQGVWLDPRLRGRGLSRAAFAQVVRMAAQSFDEISLYVNSYNLPARRLYASVGFREIETMATVLY